MIVLFQRMHNGLDLDLARLLLEVDKGVKDELDKSIWILGYFGSSWYIIELAVEGIYRRHGYYAWYSVGFGFWYKMALDDEMNSFG